MLGERLHAVSLDAQGVDGDRRYALVDEETGKVVSVKRPKRWLGIFDLAAHTAADGVHATFPGGESAHIEDPTVSARLSVHLGRSVSAAQPAAVRFWNSALPPLG